MAGAFDVLNLALAVVTVAIATGLLVLGRRSPSTVFLAVFLAGWGLAGLALATPPYLGAPMGLALALVWSIHFFIVAGLLSFALVYPNVVLTPARRRLIAGTFAAAAVAALLVFAGRDALWDEARGEFTLGAFRLGMVFVALSYAPAAMLLGGRWLRSAPGDYRTQVTWGFLPFAFWALHDGLGFLVYPGLLRPDGVWSEMIRDPVALAAAAVGMLGVVVTLAIMAVALARVFRGRAAADDRAMGFLLLYGLPVTLLQVLDPVFGTNAQPTYHIIVDYAIVPIVVYGVLRHQVVDIDLKLKWGLKHSTVAGAFVAVFFVVATVAQEFLADTLGWLTGGVAAGALLFGLAPLQRAAERLSSAALPHAKDAEGYLNYRRYQIYRVALEGTLRDGVVAPGEASALRSLRDELGLSMQDHAALEAEARARLMARAA